MKQKRKQLRLQKRIDAWTQMTNHARLFDSKVAQRIEKGGYKCPGSVKRK